MGTSRTFVGCAAALLVAAAPALAQAQSAMDRHRCGNFDQTYTKAMGFLRSAAPAKVQEPREREYYERKLREMTNLLAQMEAPQHAEVVSRKRQLAEYEALLNEKLGGAQGQPPPPTPSSLSAGDNHRILNFDREYGNNFGRLQGVKPRQLADAELVASFRRPLEYLRTTLDEMEAKDHPEIVKRREQVEAYAALLEEKLRGIAADAAAELLAAFDAAHARVMQELPAAQPSKVVEGREATFYEGKIDEMREALEPLADSQDAEVVRRRELLAACEAMYREKRRTAWTEDDRKRLARVQTLLNTFRGFEKSELSPEAAVSFIKQRADAEYAFAVFERDRPEVKHEQERLAWFDQELARVREVSRADLAKVDDLRARIAALYRKYVEQRVTPPALPGPDSSADAMRAYGQQLRRVKDEAWAACELGWDVQLGLPDYDAKTDAAVELRNQTVNVVRFAKDLHDDASKPIERFVAPALKALELDPSAPDVKTLRAAAIRERSCDMLVDLREAVPVMRLFVAFTEGHEGEVDEWTASAPGLLEQKVAALEARIEQQLVSERFTPPVVDRPELLAGAERVLRERLGDRLLGVYWDEAPVRKEGVEKKVVKETSDKIWYVNEPYDYESYVVVYAAREPTWDPRKCLLLYQYFAKNNIACNDHGVGAIYRNAGAAEFKAILVENLPGRASTEPAAPTAPATTPTTPAPTEPPSASPTGTSAPAPATDGQVGASATPTTSGGGGMCAMTTPDRGRAPVTALWTLVLVVGALLRARVGAR